VKPRSFKKWAHGRIEAGEPVNPCTKTIPVLAFAPLPSAAKSLSHPVGASFGGTIGGLLDWLEWLEEFVMA
jgi:hypothetical protein